MCAVRRPELTAPEGQRSPDDPALRSENGTLDEQVKLLVQTEQRLYRMRNELDRQLSRIRMLGDFALQSSALEQPEDIIARAAGVLLDSFDVDDVITALLDPETGTARVTRHLPDGESRTGVADVDLSAIEVHCAADRPFLVRVDSQEEVARLRPWLTVVSDGRTTDRNLEGMTVACLPLRDPEQRLTALVVACKGADGRRSYYKEGIEPDHVPFLQLLASHLEHALDMSVLTFSLHERSEQLAEVNRQLTASLETLERTQRQLVDGQKMEAIGRLAGGVAHDFNNLLTLILGHAHLLQTTLRADPRALQDVGKIVGAGERAAAITSQLLAFSRKQKRTPEVIHLNELARNMAHMLERLVGDHIRLDLVTGESVRTIRADRSQLEQIVLNLVVNARDAMAQGGVITMRTRPALPEDAPTRESAVAEGVALEVVDTGHGMDGDTMERIFEPFFTTKEVGHGTGMGLATVYGLVQQNEGSIKVESEVGNGTRFIAVFPSSADGASGEPESATLEQTSTRARILVVEDEDGVRALAARILRNGGYQVTSATDGEDAVEHALSAAEPFDLLLTDVAMPRLNGVDLAARLRTEKEGLRVVFMSGHAPESLDVPPQGGLDSFIQKPFSPRGLLDHVRVALATDVAMGGT